MFPTRWEKGEAPVQSRDQSGISGRERQERRQAARSIWQEVREKVRNKIPPRERLITGRSEQDRDPVGGTASGELIDSLWVSRVGWFVRCQGRVGRENISVGGERSGRR